MLSVVVPTRNESGNIATLLRRLSGVLPAGEMEIIFVDDSTDDTPAEIERCRQDSAVDVVLIHRAAEDRVGGLGGAVVAGMHRARGTWVCVMDGDLQHPPEVVAQLLDAARQQEVDLVVGSRFCENGNKMGLKAIRSLVSKGTTAAARALFPVRLREVTDPMSGFFLVRKGALDLANLKPQGFKILLEILVKSRKLSRHEVGFEFASRHAGASKASLSEGLTYLRHIATLRWATIAKRTSAPTSAPGRRGGGVLRFGIVGLTGLLVNQLVLAGLVEISNINVLLASILATQGSTLWNFLLTDKWVFAGASSKSGWKRFIPFWAVNNSALLLRVPALALLAGVLGLHYLIANLVTLVALFAMRYLVADKLIWKSKAPSAEAPAAASADLPSHVRVAIDITDGGPKRPNSRPSRHQHHYKVGGIVSIASAVRLPELVLMSAFVHSGAPDIEIVRGAVGSLAMRRTIGVTEAPGFVSYEEQLGRLGANFSIEFGSTIRVTVGPLLAHSPHVVYTNVIEPLLRFVLISKNHALVHAAVLEMDGKGVMIAAPADTGKTSTLLRLVAERRAGFLADDMAILSPDGLVYAYPKPLNVSPRSLACAGVRLRGAKSRAGVRMQSRLHSRGGRSAGKRVAERNLPIMGINAAVQRLVPPPKFPVHDLLPCSVLASAPLGQLVFIERGTNATSPVSHSDAVDALLAHSDDAYGFPPFAYFAPSISIGGVGYAELRMREREIVEQAITACPALRLARDDFSWADAVSETMVTDVTMVDRVADDDGAGRLSAPADTSHRLSA